MSVNQLFLVIISGLGVIHGLFLSIFLLSYKKGNLLANRLLSILLIVLSFRIGKSVFLEFLIKLDAKIIFIGLGTMMAIGPLFYLFSKALSNKAFQWSNQQYLHFIPSLMGILFGFWVTEDHLITLPKSLFAVLFISYYLQFLIYLVITKWMLRRQQEEVINSNSVKLLNLSFYGLLIIWVAYVCNLFDESIPYIIGPIIYSSAAYAISFIVISKGYLVEENQEKYKTTRVSTEQMEQLYSKVLSLVVSDEQFKNPDTTLKSLSGQLHVSTQVLSMVINQKSDKNFNSFINEYRVEEAIHLLNDPNNKNLNISAIAYQSGFNSISSFNSAFKKQTGKTPNMYRKD